MTPDATTRRDVLSIGASLVTASAGLVGLLGAYRAGTLTGTGRRAILTSIVLGGETRLGRLTQSLARGGETLAGWFDSMAFEVARLDAAAVLAVAEEPIGLADVVEYQREYAFQYNFLNGFRSELAAGVQLLSGAVARSALYAHAAWGVGYNVQRFAKGRGGFSEYARILGASDHCDDCRAAADRGYVPLVTADPLPRIGGTRCKARCHCWFSYR